MKIVVTKIMGLSDDPKMGEFKIEAMKIKSKNGTRETLPVLTRASGGPVPPIKVDKDEKK